LGLRHRDLELCANGQFAFTKFTAVSLRAQVIWGALWTRMFGESFEVLRASTLFPAVVAIVVVHRILLRAGAPGWGRVVGTLTMLAFIGLLLFKRQWVTGSPAEFAIHYRVWQESSSGDRGQRPITPIAFNHASASGAHAVAVEAMRRNPNAWPPFAKMWISEGTPALRRAAA
jgi:hypothetical protein